jgi:hypothetical protein
MSANLRLLVALTAILTALAIGPRIAAAAHQCLWPLWPNMVACFTHDVLTGEDL